MSPHVTLSPKAVRCQSGREARTRPSRAHARCLAVQSLLKEPGVTHTVGLGSGNMTRAAARAPNVGTTPGGDALGWYSCGSIRCVLIHSAIIRGERQRRSVWTTLSRTRETWTCSGTKATGNRSASAAIQRRRRRRKDDGAESSPGRREQGGRDFGDRGRVPQISTAFGAEPVG
jgi:hypothetical protein